ncbi:hypothetical protein LIER_39040 [Lithospermum erythrorhizon]|uniref:Uncharacterized protein n=1 Tax=Lithospermum erythrorhizon TaxID=34254 RepID=A0AAV3QAC6_LITER
MLLEIVRDNHIGACTSVNDAAKHLCKDKFSCSLVEMSQQEQTQAASRTGLGEGTSHDDVSHQTQDADQLLGTSGKAFNICFALFQPNKDHDHSK